jgi:spermidine/putrescine ABC transporter ATP-binding subunit
VTAPLGEPGDARDLVVSGLTRRFGGVTALAGVDLVVRRGEVVTILGPSGSGKTTLLKIVAGYETPDGGSVRVGTEELTALAPGKRNIGMVFQNYALFPHMTVAQNIAFPLEMRKVDRATLRDKVGWALQTVGLPGYEARFPRQLSGGQQQRVALARAIVFDPKLLLLDEPFGALDRKLREQMQLEVKALQRRLGVTTLFVTHDQEEALVLSDRIAVMSHGRIEQFGTPQQIYAHPVNRFVADFIGDSNVLEARVESVDGARGVAVLDGGARVQVSPRAGSIALAPGAIVALVLRPERICRQGDEARPSDPDNRFAATVVSTVYLGESTKLRLALDGGPEVVARWPFSERLPVPEAGARVAVGWSAGDAHVVPGG